VRISQVKEGDLPNSPGKSQRVHVRFYLFVCIADTVQQDREGALAVDLARVDYARGGGGAKPQPRKEILA
jgi:hypothetical protein